MPTEDETLSLFAEADEAIAEVDDADAEDIALAAEDQDALPPPAGHNNPPEPAVEASNIETINPTAQNKLKSIVERIERLAEDRAAVMADMKEVYSEAKGEGFDTKILRKVIRLRQQDTAKRQEEEALVDLYVVSIGGL